MTLQGIQSFKFATLVAFTGLAIGPVHIFAAAIPTADGGSLNLVNKAPLLVGVTTVSPCINFGGGAICTPGQSFQMTVSSGSSADFSAVASATDQMMDISTFPPPNLVNFQTVAGGTAVAGATVHFYLTQMVLTNGGLGFGDCSSSAANLPNNHCSPAFSPFTFAEDSSGTQVTIQFSVLMNAYTGSSLTGTTPYRGIFTTQQSGTLVGTGACSGITANITNILNCQAANGTITATWSAAESPIPGPPAFKGCTVTQGGWGAPPHGNNPGAILVANFPTVYPTGVEIGEPGFNFLLFTSAAGVQSFLPQGGPPSFLNSSATIPPAISGTSAGVFAGQVLALQLNVGIYNYGSKILCGNWNAVRRAVGSYHPLNAANVAIGEGILPPGFASFSAFNDLIDELNSAFDGCVKRWLGFCAAHLI